MRNKKLVKKYPFLLPRNVWTGKVPKDYDYTYTEYGCLSKGWKAGFGEFWLEDLREALIKTNFMDKFMFMELKEKYGCYDKETEVLTKNGWKYFKDLSFEDEIATLNTKTDELEYQKPDDIIAYKYNGEMYRLENRGLSICVTPNHNLYVSKGSYVNGSKNNEKRIYPYELTTPKKYFGKDKRFKKGCKWKGNEPNDIYKIKGYEYTNKLSNNKDIERTYTKPNLEFPLIPFLRFLGFYIAEGHSSMNTRSHNCEINIAYNKYDEEELITKLITGIGFNVSSKTKGCKQIHNVTLSNWLYENCGHLASNKKVPDFIKELPPKYIEEFLTYLFIGDGHKTKTYNILTTTSKQLSNDVQELLLKCGYAFRETVRYAEERNKRKNGKSDIDGRKIISKHDSYEINWLKLSEIEIDNSKAKYTKSFIEEWIPYKGMVYCVTVPNHIIYVRRNGKGYWCGNSFRQYCNGAPEEVHEVIRKYEYISEYICYQCGSPHACVVNDYGWYLPLCKDCWDKNNKKRAEKGYKVVSWEEVADERCTGLPDEYKYTTYLKGEDITTTVDISETANKIRKKFEKKKRIIKIDSLTNLAV